MDKFIAQVFWPIWIMVLVWNFYCIPLSFVVTKYLLKNSSMNSDQDLKFQLMLAQFLITTLYVFVDYIFKERPDID